MNMFVRTNNTGTDDCRPNQTNRSKHLRFYFTYSVDVPTLPLTFAKRCCNMHAHVRRAQTSSLHIFLKAMVSIMD